MTAREPEVCEHCKWGLAERKRLIGNMKAIKVLDEGYGTHETSSLIVMLTACVVATQNDTLSVDMSKKLHELRKELDRRIPL